MYIYLLLGCRARLAEPNYQFMIMEVCLNFGSRIIYMTTFRYLYKIFTTVEYTLKKSESESLAFRVKGQ